MAYTEQPRSAGRLGSMLGPLLVLALIVAVVVVIATLPEHTRKELLYIRAGLPADRDVPDARRPAVLGLPGGVRPGRRGADLRPDRLLPRHLQAGRVLQLRAAHLWPGGRELGAGLDPDLHLHGRRHGEERHRQRSALLRPGAAEARARRAGARRHHHGHDPRGHDRHHRRLGDHDDRAGAAHHDAAGL